MKNPTVAGLDARLDYVPEHIRAEKIAQYGQTRKAAAEAIYTLQLWTSWTPCATSCPR